jgi:hypothetical protein
MKSLHRNLPSHCVSSPFILILVSALPELSLGLSADEQHNSNSKRPISIIKNSLTRPASASVPVPARLFVLDTLVPGQRLRLNAGYGGHSEFQEAFEIHTLLQDNIINNNTSTSTQDPLITVIDKHYPFILVECVCRCCGDSNTDACFH